MQRTSQTHRQMELDAENVFHVSIQSTGGLLLVVRCSLFLEQVSQSSSLESSSRRVFQSSSSPLCPNLFHAWYWYRYSVCPLRLTGIQSVLCIALDWYSVLPVVSSPVWPCPVRSLLRTGNTYCTGIQSTASRQEQGKLIRTIYYCVRTFTYVMYTSPFARCWMLGL